MPCFKAKDFETRKLSYWFIKANEEQVPTYIESCPVRMRKMQIFFKKLD